MRKSLGRRTVWTIIVSSIVTLAGTTMLVHAVSGSRQAEAMAPPAQVEDKDAITILGSGDLLVHPPTWKQAVADAAGTGRRYDFRKLLAGTAEDVRSADLALCHMEAPLGPGAPQDFPRFNAPTELATAVRDTGYDGCSTASNHALDQGPAGVAANIKALDAAGLGHTGTYATQAGAGTGYLYTVKGVKIGHLAYTYGINRTKTTTWMVNTIQAKAVLAAARALRTQGAQITVLSLHGGDEYNHQPDADQQAQVKQFIASPDIDLILGHHTHVVQPFQKVGGKWVAFGLGNGLARHDKPTDDNRTGVMAKFTFHRNPQGKWVATRAEAIMTWLTLKPALRVITLPRVIASLPTLDRRRGQYEQTLNVGAVYVDGFQAVKDGLVINGYHASGGTP